MALINNLELMRVEPKLFEDAGSSGMVLATATDGVISSNTLSSASSDFTAAGVAVGDIVVADGEAMEITAINSATSLSVSRRRSKSATSVLQPKAGTTLSLSIFSFEIVIERVESWVLVALGIGAGQGVQLADVLNQEDLKRLIVLRTIAQGFARSAAVDPLSAPLAALEVFYEQLADETARLTLALVDSNGDGQVDAVRKIGAAALTRN